MNFFLVAVGVLSFGVMALADWLDIVKKSSVAGAVFAGACLMLAVASVGLLVDSGVGSSPVAPVFWCGAGVMLAVLVYTVFVAVRSDKPWQDGLRPLADTGVYALCRHPGVLWLAGMYFFVWCACGGAAWLAAFLLFSGADALYVLWQDRVIFPASIQNYKEYQNNTPFLIPNTASIRHCLQTIAFSGVRKNKGGEPKDDV